MEMREELKALREVMRKEGITAWLSPCSDAHGSEYIGEHDQCVRFLSGFTGDSCTLLVLENSAFLWTDGRYFEQAEKELSGSGISLMKMGEPGVPTLNAFLGGALKAGHVLAFQGELLGAGQGEALSNLAAQCGAELVTDKDLPGEIWADRPARSREAVWIHELRYAGKSTAEKLEMIRAEMKQKGCSVFLTSALDETAWLLNLRGSDIECNPVFLSHVLLRQDSCEVFLQEETLSPEVKQYLQDCGVRTRDYDSFGEALRELAGETILLDRGAVSFAVWNAVREKNRTEDGLSPVAAVKCAKNETEIRCMKDSHLRDGVYLTKYLYWLKKTVASGKKIKETDGAAVLDGLRAGDRKYVSLSFPTISAYGPNAAMAHYMPKPETAAVLQKKGLYLVDSGAQYLDGTTDVTRTIALGRTTKQERRDYTLTVIGMLRLMHAVFPKGVRGINLDTYARQVMWTHGVDFNHGTGHGVGYLNNVHEMPVSVRMRPSADPKRDVPYRAGMVTSDEPGVYVPGKYGIRTENMILCVPHPKYEGFFAFEPLTLAPLDPAPLDISLMTEEELRWYNGYQVLVRKKIGPKLTKEERDWLNNETRELGREE